MSTLPTISLCMIVKNESANLARCLASAKPYVDEIIVVDTGSQDNSIEIARQFGARISHFDWCDDFAIARNVSLDLALGTWILVLDADEELILQKSLHDQLDIDLSILGFYFPRIDIDQAGERQGDQLTRLKVLRLFRNLPELRYKSCYHEQLLYREQILATDQLRYIARAEILHYGFMPDLLQQKMLERNIPMLERLRQQGSLNITLTATLAGFYERTGQLDKAEACKSEAFENLMPHLLTGEHPDCMAFIPTLMHLVGEQSFKTEDYETVRLICQRGLEWYPDFPPLLYLAGDFLKALGFTRGAIAYYEQCLQLGQNQCYLKWEIFDQQYISIYPAYAVTCLYTELRQWSEARSALKLAYSFHCNLEPIQRELSRLEEILDQHELSEDHI